MPITTDPAFNTQNSNLAKQPLYLLFIDGIPDSITTFVAEQALITLEGYGLNPYGKSGYGQ
jgi:hypothetical protein